MCRVSHGRNFYGEKFYVIAILCAKQPFCTPLTLLYAVLSNLYILRLPASTLKLNSLIFLIPHQNSPFPRNMHWKIKCSNKIST